MSMIRATFFFQNTRAQGWSETLFTLDTTLSKAGTDAYALAKLRAALMGAETSLIGIRVSDDLVKRDSQLVELPEFGITATYWAATPPDSDFANTCVVVRMSAADNIHRRSLYLRGIPDNVITLGGAFNPSPAFLSNFNTWANAVSNGTWAIKSRVQSSTVFPISLITQATPSGLITVTTPSAHGFVQAQQVVMAGVKGSPFLNGVWKIFSVPSPTTFTFLCNTIFFDWLGVGTVTALNYQLYQIATCVAERIGSRKAGRPFGVPPGRRKATRPR